MGVISPAVPVLYWPSLVASVFFAAYWIWRVPSPGIAIGALGAAGVLVAIKGEKLHEGHKVVWAVITLFFLIAEIRAIHKDRSEYAAEQTKIRKVEAKEFQTIADNIELSNKQASANFSTEMQGVKSTLETAQQTLANTAPNAIIEFDTAAPIQLVLPFKAQQEIDFNVAYTNIGNDTPEKVLIGATLSVGELDNRKDDARIAKFFDQWWRTTPAISDAQPFNKYDRKYVVPPPPHQPRFVSFAMDHLLTDKEADGLNHGATLYATMRAIYSDRTGQWGSETCLEFQNVHTTNEQVSVLTHSCHYHNRHRYAVDRTGSAR